MSHPKPTEPRPSQVSPKTILVVAAGALAVWLAVTLVVHTLLALALTAAALMLAVALNHGVVVLCRHKVPRPLAIAAILALMLAFVAAIGFVIIPPAAAQGKALFLRLPEIFKAARSTRLFERLDEKLHLASRILSFEKKLPEMVEGAAAPILSLLGGVLTGLTAVATVTVVAVFMLIFGSSLVEAVLGESLPRHRTLYDSVIEKIYRVIGGYLTGLAFICSVNAILTTTFLAIVRLPFFLPLGIMSGISSLVPYAGPVTVGATVTVIALATGGMSTGIACAIYFVAYGQLEGQVLSPLVFKRTVQVNPLIAVLAILFFGELGGIFGAVMAVPATATMQIILREVLRIRRERLHLAATPLNSPEE